MASREHPPAIVVRQQERDIGALLHATRDFNEGQSQLFFALTSLLAGYRAPELQPLIDLDVADATAALAATLETSSRGVIYEHRPASLPAERLAGALKSLIAKAGHAGSAFERDAAVVLRRIEEAARRGGEPGVENRRAFLDLVGRLVKQQDASPDTGSADLQAESSRLIVP
jgi:hypothetical protein